MVLNDLEICVVACTSMRFTEKEALAYLQTQKHEISSSTYYRTLGHISAEVRKRAFEHAKNFLEDHIGTIDELLYIKKIMYQSAILENDRLKKTLILAKIAETMIPFISAFKEATKDIIIEEVKNKIGKENEPVDLSTFGV